jgi:hypothetical protein
MHRRRGIWILGLLVAALGAAAVGVHSSSAAPTRAAAGPASTLDKTFSCRVRRGHFINLSASATIPPANGQPQAPGGLYVTTVKKTRTQNGVVVTLTQVSLSARKNSLRIDTSVCSRVKHQIPLKPKGLSGPVTVTPHHQGFDNEQCGTAARVLVRLRLTSTGNTPTHALLAVRNENAKRRPIAFYSWSPDKVNVYTGNSCTSSS